MSVLLHRMSPVVAQSDVALPRNDLVALGAKRT
jgi:hypothetical protein